MKEVFKLDLLETVSWVAIALGILQTAIITIDVIRHPQKMMPIMNIVWPLTGLYFPLIGIWAYYKLGKSSMDDTDHHRHEHMNHDGHEQMEHHGHGEKPFWQSVFVSTTHCSSGCSLGDMIGVPIVALTGLTIAGTTLLADYTVEFILAYLFGIAFQYYGMGFKKHDEPGKAIKNAIKADTWSLIAFEIGMFGWMAIVHYLLFVEMPAPTTPVFWFMMQIAMMLGFLTSYPANWILVKKGIKHAM
ncbi:hypothetical protein CFK37_07490 [Virgibacillus phasianinus]|uniref:DUF4396 domain-containing protein n=1 Tax=Virgibacillus phasianinus TaxID=2017483 RepID=A0A220U2L7_9BACI|nr:DUF4396 domain-containing protein [Virgibacillus phasianinus]ASK62013.1 hypothetical protein CFK37_07490 [Virgibacillus phasianinus]